jgi:hypothetical protein
VTHLLNTAELETEVEGVLQACSCVSHHRIESRISFRWRRALETILKPAVKKRRRAEVEGGPRGSPPGHLKDKLKSTEDVGEKERGP